jgi:pyochelin biosynthetic protein PchC
MKLVSLVPPVPVASAVTNATILPFRLPAAPPDLWLSRLTSRPKAELRLYCLNWSGAGASAFRQLAGSVPETIEVVAAQIPGRGSRRNEPARTRLAPLAALIARAIASDLSERPSRFAILGHSYGALMAYAVTRRLEASGLSPELAVLSGSRSPSTPPWTLLHPLDDARLTGQLCRMGGMPPERLADQAFLNHLLPIVRADLTACETYLPSGASPLSCPVSVWAGRDDWYARPGDVAGWEHHARSAWQYREFEGGHFFITADQAATTSALLDDMAWSRATAESERMREVSA